MSFTPTFKGAALAGFLVWLLAWATLFKLDKIPGLKRIFNRDRILEWIGRNKVVTLLCTEAINFGVHGVAKPESAIFALGGTALNTAAIFAWIPLQLRRIRKAEGEALLKKGFAA